mmetsp:Transcript_8244/g.9489  ORF Transcript_8244/g.9489 Transcript_8244/m.9489 type:complete len:371 (+) Transcript_8244:111-1223(+)
MKQVTSNRHSRPKIKFLWIIATFFFISGFVLGFYVALLFAIQKPISPDQVDETLKVPKNNASLNPSEDHKIVNQSYLEKVLHFQKAFDVGKSDKLGRHGYHWFYGNVLDEFRTRSGVTMLEIGAEFGKSAVGWANYFSDIKIDVYSYKGKNNNANDFKFNCEGCSNVHVFSGDQADTDRLDEMMKERKEGWDIIIDDASHVPYHQVITFEHLWKKVKPGGYYIIEDIETSYYPDSGLYNYYFKAGINATAPHNAVNRFKQYIDVINRGYFGEGGKDFSYFGDDKDIMEIIFSRNVICLKKKFNKKQRDANGKPYAYYPRKPVELLRQELIELTLSKQKEIYNAQNKDLDEWRTAPSFLNYLKQQEIAKTK